MGPTDLTSWRGRMWSLVGRIDVLVFQRDTTSWLLPIPYNAHSLFTAPCPVGIRKTLADHHAPQVLSELTCCYTAPSACSLLPEELGLLGSQPALEQEEPHPAINEDSGHRATWKGNIQVPNNKYTSLPLLFNTLIPSKQSICHSWY